MSWRPLVNRIIACMFTKPKSGLSFFLSLPTRIYMSKYAAFEGNGRSNFSFVHVYACVSVPRCLHDDDGDPLTIG